MGRKRYTPEQIIGVLRETEVALAQGQRFSRTADICYLFELLGNIKRVWYFSHMCSLVAGPTSLHIWSTLLIASLLCALDPFVYA